MSFKSVMQHIGHDIKIGFEKVLPWIETTGEVAVSTFFPALSPLFNATVSAVVLAEQKYVALGQEKMGPQKLSDVLNLMSPVITQALKDAGKDSSIAAVTSYINAVVTILNTTPASALPTGNIQVPTTPSK